MAISEKIVISLVDAFSDGFENADKKITKLNRSLSNTSNYSKIALNGLAAMGTAAASALGAAYAQATNWVSAVSDISKKTGMATESASRLLGMAQVVGLSGDEMSGAMMKMSKSVETAYTTMQKANAEGKASTDVFTKWGISITDSSGQLLSADAILANIKARHRDMANGIQKSAMEMEIFGKTGGNLNSLLNLTDEQIARVNSTMEKSGLIVDGKTSEAYKNFKFEVNNTELALRGMAVSIGNQLIPQVANLGTSIAQTVASYNNLDTGTKELITTTLEVTAGVGAFSVGLRSAIFVIGPMIEGIATLISKLMELKASYDAVAISKAAALGGAAAIATVAASAVYKGYTDYKNYNAGGTMTYDDTGNVHILAPGEAAGEGQTSVGPSKSWADEEDKDDATTYQWQKQMDDMRESMAKAGNTAVDTGKKIAAAASIAAAKVDTRIPWVENMKVLGQNNFPYYYKDYTGNPGDSGTNCALAVSTAMNGTPYGNNGNPFTGVDQFINLAKELGQFHLAGTYTGKPGDLIITNYSATSGHMGIITDQGTIIQNGQHGGANGNGGIEDTASAGTPYAYISTSELLTGSHNATLTGNALINNKMQALQGYKSTATSFASEIRDMGITSESQRIINEARDKITKINEEISKAKAQGINTSDLEKMKSSYLDATKKKLIDAQRTEQDEAYQSELEHISRMTDLEQGYTDDMNQQLTVRLNDYRSWLEEQLADTKLNVDQRKKFEEDLSDVMRRQNDINATSASTAWDVAARKIKNTTVDYSEIITSAWDNVSNALLQSTQDLVGGEESLGDRLIGLIKNISNAVLTMYMQIAMQQSILTPLKNAFTGAIGGGFGGGSIMSSVFNSESLFENSTPSWDEFADVFSIPGYASGGRAQGLVKVGEHGMELMDLSNPARVYSNDDLSRAVSGSNNSGRGANITMNVYTNDAGSFKQSRSQILGQMAAGVRRGAAYV